MAPLKIISNSLSACMHFRRKYRCSYCFDLPDKVTQEAMRLVLSYAPLKEDIPHNVIKEGLYLHKK